MGVGMGMGINTNDRFDRDNPTPLTSLSGVITQSTWTLIVNDLGMI